LSSGPGLNVHLINNNVLFFFQTKGL